ncbi:MAG TPA: hypothetical protein VGF49_04055 [Candidatus Solibacter sp.]
MNSTAKKLSLSTEIREGLSQMRLKAALAEISLINGTLVHSVRQGEVETVCGDCHTADRVVTNRQAFEAICARTDQRAAQLATLISSGDERKALGVLQAGVASWARLYRQYLSLAEQRDFPKAHKIMVGEIYPLVQRMDAASDQLITEQEKSLGMLRKAASRQVTGSLRSVSVAVGLCIGLFAGREDFVAHNEPRP